MFVVALLFMGANAIVAVVMVIQTLRTQHELDTMLSGFGGVIQRVGAGAFVWQFCPILESVVYLWVPLPRALIPYWTGIGAACLLSFGIAWWLTQRAFPAFPSQTAMNGMSGVMLAIGSLYETDSLRKAISADWTPWLLIIGAGLLELEALLILLLSIRGQRVARRAATAQQPQD